ncbi:MAG: hypothetical protein AAGD43_26205 [Pseudomonadota bacterium]
MPKFKIEVETTKIEEFVVEAISEVAARKKFLEDGGERVGSWVMDEDISHVAPVEIDVLADRGRQD